MGWISKHASDLEHEGYTVAVERLPGSSWLWREITMAEDEQRARDAGHIDVTHVQAACVCGWRSQRFPAPFGTEWSPAMVWFPSYMGDSSYYDNIVGKIWFTEHDDAFVADGPISLMSAAKLHGVRPDWLTPAN